MEVGKFHNFTPRPTSLVHLYTAQVIRGKEVAGRGCACPGIEQALETAALMLGTDKSRGYCLEMICADFLAGANLENGNLDALLISMGRLFEFLPRPKKQEFLEQIGKAS